MHHTHIWLRAESKPKEERTPLTPIHARRLIDAGFRVTVERSTLRAFPDEAYDRSGCEMAATGAWMEEAPGDAIILGLKELPEASFALPHRHIYFAHAYKNQQGWKETLGRYVEGEGTLLDLEYLTDDTGRRVAAFGHWAGFVGAGVGVLTWANQVRTGARELLGPLHSYPSQEEFVAAVRAELLPAIDKSGVKPRALVIGAKGRCGKGATQLLNRMGIAVTEWDMAETAKGGPFPEILEHEIFVNCVLVQTSMPPFITKADVAKARKLSVIADVSCDPNGPYNPIPLYTETTNFSRPTVRVSETPALDIVAIDHLPSMLPKESSEDFSEQLLPHLLKLKEGSSVWDRALRIFHTKTESLR